MQIEIKKPPQKTNRMTVIYGAGGVGKSTLASQSDSPLFLPVVDERGLIGLDVGVLPCARSIDDVIEILNWALTGDNAKDYKTFVLDSIGFIQDLIHIRVIKDNQVKSLSDITYGKGYPMTMQWWGKVLARLDKLVLKMNVIILAHSTSVARYTATGESYKTIDVALQDYEKASALESLKRLADNIFYYKFEVENLKKRGMAKVATLDSPPRRIFCSPSGAYFAKRRVGMEDFYDIDDKKSIDLFFDDLGK